MRFGVFTSLMGQTWPGVLELWQHLESTGWDTACVLEWKFHAQLSRSLTEMGGDFSDEPVHVTPSAPSAQPPLREIRKVLQAPEFDRLTYISRKSGTHIVQK